MTPVNRRQEQESARGSYQGDTPGIFIVLAGFAATDLSVRFRDTRQGGGAYGKSATPDPFLLSSGLTPSLLNLLSVSR